MINIARTKSFHHIHTNITLKLDKIEKLDSVNNKGQWQVLCTNNQTAEWALRPLDILTTSWLTMWVVWWMLIWSSTGTLMLQYVNVRITPHLHYECTLWCWGTSSIWKKLFWSGDYFDIKHSLICSRTADENIFDNFV